MAVLKGSHKFLSFLYTGCIVATLAIIVSDLFGPKLLSDAYGLSIFARGPGNLIGSPFSGTVVYIDA